MDGSFTNFPTDLSSPTVLTSTVFTLVAIAAHEGRHAAVVDVGGAFLNAEMSGGLLVHMRLIKTMTDFLIESTNSVRGRCRAVA